jgi:hypothetical protein
MKRAILACSARAPSSASYPRPSALAMLGGSALAARRVLNR